MSGVAAATEGTTEVERRKTSSSGSNVHGQEVDALVIFSDVRGFTNWSADIEVFANLENFIDPLMEILRKSFKPGWFQELGDGAVIVEEIPSDLTKTAERALIRRTLKKIARVESEFGSLCLRFAERIGHHADLHLGWGVTRGKVKKLREHYAGSNLNKCSRICALARPWGIAVDYDDFPILGEVDTDFKVRRRKLTGIGEVDVWLQSHIAQEFMPREKQREIPEVHVAGVCIDDRDPLRVLIARRSPSRQLYPGLYEGCGGQLRLSESFTAGVQRHFRQELGIEVEVLEEFHTLYQIAEPNTPLIPGIRFLCRALDLSGQFQTDRHDRVEWISVGQFKRMPAALFVGNLKLEVARLIDLYRATR